MIPEINDVESKEKQIESIKQNCFIFKQLQTTIQIIKTMKQIIFQSNIIKDQNGKITTVTNKI